MLSLHAGIAFFLMRAVHDAEWTFQAFKDLGNRDFARVFAEQVAALGAVVAINKPALCQGLENFGEQFSRD